MCAFDGPDLRTNSEVLVSFSVRCRNVYGTFVERFFLTVLTLLVIPQNVKKVKITAP